MSIVQQSSETLGSSGIHRVSFAWDLGAGDDQALTVDEATTRQIAGSFLSQVETRPWNDRLPVIPSASGSVGATFYDLEIQDPYGIDLLSGDGLNRSGTDDEVFVLDPARLIRGPITVKIANSGESRMKGNVDIFVSRKR